MGRVQARISRFQNRGAAGRALAGLLGKYARSSDVIVMALPRGGVVVGAEVARALHVALDVIGVRKIGAPRQPELAIGAVASGGVRVWNQSLIDGLDVAVSVLDEAAQTAETELAHREMRYRHGRPYPELRDRRVIVVDDGVATGATMSAAISAVAAMRPRRIVAAVPFASPRACIALGEVADEVVCLWRDDQLVAVSQAYMDFAQVTDGEVITLLAEVSQHGDSESRERLDAEVLDSGGEET